MKLCQSCRAKRFPACLGSSKKEARVLSDKEAAFHSALNSSVHHTQLPSDGSAFRAELVYFLGTYNIDPKPLNPKPKKIEVPSVRLIDALVGNPKAKCSTPLNEGRAATDEDSIVGV